VGVRILNAKRKKYLFRSLLPKNPSQSAWIFSFVPIGTTSFAWYTQHHFERSENIIAARGTNERG